VRITAVVIVVLGVVATLLGLLGLVIGLGGNENSQIVVGASALGGGLMAILLGGCAWIFLDVASKLDASVFQAELTRIAANTRKPGDLF